MDTTAIKPASTAADYESDFHAWCVEQAASLRARARPGVNDGLDYAHLAEEIEGLGKSLQHAIRSHLSNLLLHLLKWQFQPRKRSKSWRKSITNARNEIEALLEDNPGLAGHPGQVLARAYKSAVREAADETGRTAREFPSTCPWTIEQVLDFDFLPGDEPSS